MAKYHMVFMEQLPQLGGGGSLTGRRSDRRAGIFDSGDTFCSAEAIQMIHIISNPMFPVLFLIVPLV